MAMLSFSGKMGSGKDTAGQIAQILLNSPQLSTEGVMTFLKKGIGANRVEYCPGWEIKKFADKLKDIVCLLIGCTREQLEDREFKEKELGEEWWYWKLKVPSYNLDRNEKITLEMMFNTETEAWEYNDKILSYNREVCETVLIKPTPRLFMQLLGTEAGRQIIHPNIWVNSLMAEHKPIKRKGYGVPMQYGGLYKIPEDSKYLKNHWNRIIPCKEFEWEELPNWIITDTRFLNELKAVEDRNGITIRVNRPCNICGGSGYHKMSCPVSKSGEHCSETTLDKSKFDYTIENDSDIQTLVEKIKEILIKEKLL